MSFFRILARPSVCSQCRAYATKATKATARSAGPKPSKTLEKTAKAPSPASSTAISQSSCPADTILPGVNYLKGQSPVLALPDDQYPQWLWTILKPKVYPDDGPGGKAERVRMRRENKNVIKEKNFMSTQ